MNAAFDLGEKLKSANQKNIRKYQKIGTDIVVTIDGQQESAHLKQLCLLFPQQNSKQESGDESETNVSQNGNLELAKAFTGYMKVCQVPTDQQEAKLANIIDEKPKRR